MIRGFLVAVILLAASGSCGAATPASLCQMRVAASLHALVQGEYSLATRYFDAPLARQHDPANMRLTWAALLRQGGTYRGRAAPSWQTVAGRRYLFTTLTFAHGSETALDACDATGRIQFFEWGPASDAARKIRNARQRDYPDGVRELPRTVASAWGPLPATLTLPGGDGPFPAVLLVAGAGKNDEDESLGPNKPFRDLALGLARAGIASLRYDKSIMAYPSKAGLSPHLTIDDTVTDDALGLATLSAQKRVDRGRLFLLGHSLGAMVAPRIARRARVRLAGIILMGAPALPILGNAVWQVRYLDSLQHAPAAATLRQQLKLIHDEQALLARSAPGNPAAGNFLGMPQSWWLSLHAYDQVAAARSLDQPLLLLQGASDHQVQPPYNFFRWQQVFAHDPRVRLIEYPGLSHIFMPAGSPPSPADYARPEHVDARVIRDIAQWILTQTSSNYIK